MPSPENGLRLVGRDAAEYYLFFFFEIVANIVAVSTSKLFLSRFTDEREWLTQMASAITLLGPFRSSDDLVMPVASSIMIAANVVVRQIHLYEKDTI